MARAHSADIVVVSTVGKAADASALQAAQVQQLASKARDKERAAGETARRGQDAVDLRVAGAETSEAVRPVTNEDEARQRNKKAAKRKPQSKPARSDDDEPRAHIDLRA